MTTKDFRGRLYLPAGNARPVAIVVIGGSEGHLYLADEIAPELTQEGFAVLGIDYHDGYDSGRKLHDVPIETFTQAVAWLRSSAVHPAAVAVLGDSRGSEAALLTGIYDPTVAAVLGFVPSSVVWGATDDSDAAHASGWSWRGKPLLCAGCSGGSSDWEKRLDALPADAPQRIAVERIHGPIFLAASKADAVWPSARMAMEIADRLTKSNFAYPVTLAVFPASSHQLLGKGPKEPVSQYTVGDKTYTFNQGGTAAGTREARDSSWAMMLAFLACLH